MKLLPISLFAVAAIGCASGSSSDCSKQTGELKSYLAGLKASSPRPPASSVHDELEAVRAPAKAEDAAQKLATGTQSGIPAKVFRDCPAVIEWLPKLANLSGDERIAAENSELPALLEGCKCNVEIAAVKELLWAWRNP